jgi:peptidoglycan/xylan/chitin deacetylase (PgdA/CDA1 family)
MKERKIAITFDDGPHPIYTPQILKILHQKKIVATFFLCGKNIQRYPYLVKKIYNHGHCVGNHTYNHSFLKSLLGISMNEIETTQALIENLINQKRKLFRPPWGILPFWLKTKLQKKGFKIVMFSVYGRDWKKNITASEITQKIVESVSDGTIILLHDGHEAHETVDRSQTVKALPHIIDLLHNQGYTFVSAVDL